MKYLLVSYFVFFLLVSCTNKPSTQANGFDSSQQSEMKNGEIVTKRLDGTIKTLVTYRDGIKHGTSFLFYEDGKSIQLKIPYVVGARHGISEKYYRDGKLYAKTPYEADLLHGVRKTWYSNGNLKAEVPYFKGLTGTGTIEYFVSGKVKTQPHLFYVVDNNHLTITLDKPCKNPRIYIGELLNDQFLATENLDVFVPDQGEFRLNLDVYTPSYLAVQDIICTCETSQGNPLVIRERIVL